MSRETTHISSRSFCAWSRDWWRSTWRRWWHSAGYEHSLHPLWAQYTPAGYWTLYR